MTNEQQQLLIKDLSARLPHGVRCFIEDDYDVSRDGTLYEMDLDEETCDFKDTGKGQNYWCITNIENVKPYLRPMSSMTGEEKIEFDKLCGYCLEQDSVDYNISTLDITQLIFVIDWLNARHFDYRGLIEQGLALPAPDGMYNTKNE